MTDELSRGYWPSYNVAYFPQVYDAAGYPDMVRTSYGRRTVCASGDTRVL